MASIPLFYRLIVRPLRREMLRTVLTALAVALGVAVVIAIELAGDAAAMCEQVTQGQRSGRGGNQGVAHLKEAARSAWFIRRRSPTEKKRPWRRIL